MMSAKYPTSCSYECIISQTIKCEPKLPENLQEDDAGNQQELMITLSLICRVSNVRNNDKNYTGNKLFSHLSTQIRAQRGHVT